MIQAVAMAKDQQNNSTAMSNGSLSRQHRDTVENARQEVIDLTFDSDSDDKSTCIQLQTLARFLQSNGKIICA